MVALVVLLGLSPVPSGHHGTSSDSTGSTLVPASASLSANATYLDTGGHWNCGAGYETFTFFGGASGGAPPYTYAWSFGDGSGNLSGRNATHTYHASGAFIATLTVTDAGRSIAHATVQPIWGVPLVCSSTSPNYLGMLLYLTLIGGVVVGLGALLRYRRNHPP